MTKQQLKLLFYAAILLIGFVTNAQTNTVTGTVTDGEYPLPDVNISVKGTTNGVISDFDGLYTIKNLTSGDVLVFSYVGYITQEIAYTNQETVNVVMKEDAEALDEVVIVGYGTSSKREATSAVATIKGKEVVNTIASNPTTALQGKLSGIQIEAPGGQPGGSPNVFVRGINSLSNANPLYIVDGLFVDNMDYVNPKDIDDISVLKDAAAAAIYGSRAANGVVLIKTNHGRKNQALKVDFNARVGVDSPSKKLDFINGEQYTNYLNQRFINDGSANSVTWNGVSTDWQEESLQSGIVEDYGLSIYGGGEVSSYFGSVNYFNQDGILVGSGFKRLNARFNSEHQFNKLKITHSLGITEGELQSNNWYGFDAVTAPTIALSNPNYEGGFDGPSLPIHGPGGLNQYGLASLEDNKETTRTLFTSLKLDYDITDNLSAAVNFGLDYRHRKNYQFTPTFEMTDPNNPIDAVRNLNVVNDLTNYTQEDVNLLFEPTINYKKTFNDLHKVDVVLGYTRFLENQTSNGLYGEDTPSNNTRVASALGTLIQPLGEDNKAALLSYFGRFNYGYDSKYLFSATVRRDASSRFNKDNRVGYFPAFSGAWNISSEDFFESETVNFLKLRVSYGELGSYPDAFYPTQSVFLANQSNTSFGGTLAPGLAQTRLADPDLVWETTKTFDIGVDLAMFNNALKFTADYYTKNVDDALVPISVPSTAGVSLPVIRNAGTLVNNGFEFDLSYKKSDGDFKYNVSTNFSFNLKNEAKDIPATILGPEIDEDLRIVNRTQANSPVGAFYGWTVEHKVNPATGDFVRVDTSGDGIVDENDIGIIGDPTPDFTYGLNFTGEYKNFDIALNFNGVQGNEIYNVGRYYNILWQDGGKLTEVLNSWTPTNTDTNIPRATIADEQGNRAPSSFFVEDGSFFRLKNIELGYKFPNEVLGTDWVKDLRVSLNLQNVFVITSYSGYDPDVASTNGGRANINSGVPGVRTAVNPLLGRGLDARSYPNARTISLGVTASF
ncbi:MULTISPECIES: SusC/RagA family TonB-linked outer membrane protein [unclassified Cellulophaga]|uniref:SusC/RagA family TonB-linked outer membrane protein n=1 Tax=unclassified Cellulophaga TaxID=2634405 RepID=UPI0026E4903E|nr:MULTISPECIES: TonB-dependent receptor [unclassified Cellulophaga]MDO6492554.1 TonB-dependent receptor [Cellulophaga sp. 2_MG-2023]MDO6493656.1 TonB-dependent receptor [Cellulophaga sp. 3_MG-2023]